ncbi:hypothetical protein EST38_g6160 [Candolleomyces aberdarensis]|uniref:Uncharacterized protein n=1 Tax=Candolleomyces aberdarensis TaxID=2316362 RepID=A0A4Q2DKK1_9AGAR|nr:hypothetical protein EST38_g6160 [Candolleomyces aberdarensis]
MFLEPREATYVSLASYIAVGTLAILIWDILHNLPAGYKILFKYRIRLSTLVYVFSRITSLCYVIWCSIYYTAPIGDCNQSQTGFAAFYPAAISSSTLLFLFRVHLVYDGNPRVMIPFSLLWVLVLGGTVTAPIGLKGVAIGPTDYCMVSGAEVYVSASVIVPLVYDTVVFLAITYRLAASPYEIATTEGGFWKALAGNYLPGLSKLLLKDGQSYYA